MGAPSKPAKGVEAPSGGENPRLERLRDYIEARTRLKDFVAYVEAMRLTPEGATDVDRVLAAWRAGKSAFDDGEGIWPWPEWANSIP